MSLVVEYKGYYEPVDIPDKDFTEWKETLKGEMSRIYDSLLTRIPDETAFKNRIAEASSEEWTAFVNPAWPDADLIAMLQFVKLAGKYSDWKDGIDAAFGTGGYFPDRVDAKADKFKLVKVTLGATGLRYKFGRGIAVKAINVLTGDKTVLRDLGPNETFSGTPTNVFLPGAAVYARPQGIAITVRGLVLAYYAHAANLPDARDIVISRTNVAFANTILKQVDTTKYDVVYEIGYDPDAGKLFVHSKASLK